MAVAAPASLVVHVQITDFLVEAERFGVPALAARPVVVGGAANGAGRVVAVSPEARVRGVVPGLPLRVAARRCPRASFRAGDVERQHDLRALVDEVVRRHAPRFAWTSIDEALIVAPGGDMAALRRSAEAIRGDIGRDLGLSVAMGIARTPLAARTAARMGLPRGLVVVLPGYDTRWLAGLPLEEFDVLDPRALASLRAEGLSTVGDLARLPNERALGILGRGGAAIARLARGESSSLPETSRLPRRLCRRATLAPEDTPDEVVTRLAIDLSGVLRRQRCAAATLGLRAEDGVGSSRAHATPLPGPSADAGAIGAVARRLLGRFPAHAAGAHALSLSASGLVDTAPQGELFGEWRPVAPRGPDGAGARRTGDPCRLAG